jgi:hypothetical protein
MTKPSIDLVLGAAGSIGKHHGRLSWTSISSETDYVAFSIEEILKVEFDDMNSKND